MLGNGAYETTTTSGTGTITLSAVSGRPRFSDVAAVGNIVPYEIKDGSNYEWGYGTVSASNTLARTTITAKYVSGTYTNTGTITAITLSGNAADVYLSATASTHYQNMAGLSAAGGIKGIHGSPITSAVSGTIALTANRLYMTPIRFDAYSGECSGFRIWVNSAGAASTSIRLGLYQIGADGYPGMLMISTGTQAVDATGYFTVAASANKWINTGDYFLGLCSDGAPTIQANGAGGSVNSLGINSGSGGSPLSGLYKSYTYAALPDPGGSASWTVAATSNNPTAGLVFA